ncbi:MULTISPECIES: lactoylglutathione lyase [Staphylococcus]|uniref:lactoylglutathione lyase n=1 Tax=Staphylococcus TaxID=1279 RepID=UPI000853AEE8|nr:MULTISPECIES: lactoylglutathione lyase [Staphylococcus]MBF2751154.1 VOC family protein [Staphylococcus saprophyticus]MBF2779317.1 VOC family protein [Staphylococcus saprophyticus]MBF2780541.1 VOC family protein [Staphylococcus saprophyticus]MBN6093280.1 VOC family protein [Staphylococcus saprophyticus]MBN6094523.1 VOC family protein [Staphylococcus saprophyticus]
MNGLRSVTTGTDNLEKTKTLFKDILGLNVADKGNALRFGDAELTSGTRIHFVEIPKYQNDDNHIENIGLRIPSDEGLDEYKTILDQHHIEHSEVTDLNGHKYFEFQDQNNQSFNIYSNEHNIGAPLGMPTFDSTVNPLHQIQGLGPVLLKVNELLLTQSILDKVFGLTHFAEYAPHPDADYKVQVFRIGEGGLGGELHLYASSEEIKMPEHGIVEQIEFATESKAQFQNALQQLESIGIPYQSLDQDGEKSLRISEKSGITFILTLEIKE